MGLPARGCKRAPGEPAPESTLQRPRAAQGQLAGPHGVAQLGANFSRFTLQQRHVLWPIILWFALGSALGAFVGGLIANMLGYGQVEPGFNLKSFLFAVGGSVILLVVYRFVRGKS